MDIVAESAGIDNEGLPLWLVASVLVVTLITFLGFVVFFCLCVLFKKPVPKKVRRGFFYEDEEPISLDMIHLEHKEGVGPCASSQASIHSGIESLEDLDSMQRLHSFNDDSSKAVLAYANNCIEAPKSKLAACDNTESQ